MQTDNKTPKLQIILAQPRGFCAGVERAIEIVEMALKIYGPPVYVRHEIVHNRRVLENLKKQGAQFVEEIAQIPDGAITVFSAHGVSQKVEREAALRNLMPLDATCPLVTKVHREGQRYAEKGYEIILVGHKNHPEVEGTLGQINGKVHLISNLKDVATLEIKNPDKVSYITQTTLSVDDTKAIIKALRVKFPRIAGPNTKDICYATQNRQSAMRVLASQADLVLVVGAQNSSNSNRLCEVSRECGVPSYLVEDCSEVDFSWIPGCKTVGISAGASAPEELVQDLIAKLSEYAEIEITTMRGIVENVHFSLPAALKSNTAAVG